MTLEEQLIELMIEAHDNARAKGFWSPDQDHIAIKAERVHAEVSELVDTFARGTNDARFGFRPAAIAAKHSFNITRPIRHGGKRF